MFTKLTKKENRWAWILAGAMIAVVILFAQNASALVSYSPVAQIGTGDINSSMILNNTILPEDINTSVSSTWLFNNDIIVNRNSTTTGNHTVSKNLIVAGNTTLATTTLATTTISNLTVTTCTGCSNTSSVFIPAVNFVGPTGAIFGVNNGGIIADDATTTFYKMPDNFYTHFFVSAVVPAGKTSISSIKIIQSQTSGGNLKTHSRVSYIDPNYPALPLASSLVEYLAGTGTNGNANSIAISPSAYANITAVSSGGVVTFEFQRAGSDAADTYNADFLVYGVLFTFN